MLPFRISRKQVKIRNPTAWGLQKASQRTVTGSAGILPSCQCHVAYI
jgi:hypothetical protein